MLTVAVPDLGIVAHGDTAQELADDVASQVLHAVRDHALAAPESLAEDALMVAGFERKWPNLQRS